MGKRTRQSRLERPTLQDIIIKEVHQLVDAYMVMHGTSRSRACSIKDRLGIKNLVCCTSTAALTHRLFFAKHDKPIEKEVVSLIIELRQKYKSQPKEEEIL